MILSNGPRTDQHRLKAAHVPQLVHFLPEGLGEPGAVALVQCRTGLRDGLQRFQDRIQRLAQVVIGWDPFGHPGGDLFLVHFIGAVLPSLDLLG